MALAGLEDPMEKHRDYQLGHFESMARDVISRSTVLADESEVNNFLKVVKVKETRLERKLTQTEFSSLYADHFTYSQVEIKTEIELKKQDINKNIDKMLQPLGFNNQQWRKITDFKENKVFSQLPESGKFPVGLRVKIITEKKGDSVFSIQFPNKSPVSISFDKNGDSQKIFKMFQELFRKKSFNTQDLYEEYNPSQ